VLPPGPKSSETPRFLMHLRASETKPKANAERAVIHRVDLLGNNREPPGGVPLISIFKRERNGFGRVGGIHSAGSKNVGESAVRFDGTRGRSYR